LRRVNRNMKKFMTTILGRLQQNQAFSPPLGKVQTSESSFERSATAEEQSWSSNCSATRSTASAQAAARERRRAGSFLARNHPFHDPAHAPWGGIDGAPNAFGIRPGPGDLLDALEDFLVLVEGDMEIRVQALIDVGVASRKIPYMQPLVDADIVIDRRDEMTGEDPQTSSGGKVACCSRHG